MTKATGACPFSGMLCRECPIYLGRHSQICTAARYVRGGRPKLTYGCSHIDLDLPEDLVYSESRPKDLEDREENLTEAKIEWKGEQR